MLATPDTSSPWPRQHRELTRAKPIQARRAFYAMSTPLRFETVARTAAVSRS